MILGDGLRRARSEAHLTQEAAASALRVSRQTVSNWETGKTYPDILSVLAMSDLYGVSLDRLLKGDAQGGTVDYVTYLAECTDTVNRRHRLSAFLFLSALPLVSLLSILGFWILPTAGNEILYSFLVFLILLPLATLVTSVWIGTWRRAGKFRFFTPLVAGFLTMLTDYLTFRLANMVSFRHFTPPIGFLFLSGACVSTVGLLVGLLLSRLKKARPGQDAGAGPAGDEVPTP